MFKQVQVGRNNSVEAASPDLDDSSDDDISLTSTVPDEFGSDDEFVVEDILAEEWRPDRNEWLYLVKWADFPLKDASWEPESQMGVGSQLMKNWEDTKAQIDRGEKEAFDIKAYEEARAAARRESEERHRRRNAKRRRLGIPTTRRPSQGGTEKKLSSESSSDDEASEDSYVDDSAAGRANESRKQGKQRTTKASPAKPSGTAVSVSVPATESSTEARKSKTEPRRQSLSATKQQTQKAEAPAQSKKTNSAAPTPAASRNRPERPTSTGYQGTARKAPIKSLSSASTVTTGHSSLTSAASTSKTGFTARRSAVPSTNIFTGGKITKQRIGLKDAMSSSTKTPKLFEKHHYRRLAELKGREKEDLPPDPSKVKFFDIRTGPTAPGKRTSQDISSAQPLPAPAVQPVQAAQPVQASVITASPEPLPNPIVEEFSKPTVQDEAPPPKKKRKSVRFLVDEDDNDSFFVQEPEPMDVDDSAKGNHTTGVQNTAVRPRLHSPPAPPSADDLPAPVKKLSLADYRGSKTLTQSLDKKLVLGSSTTVDVTFHGLPRDTPSQWLASFLQHEVLEFKHTCFSQTFIVKMGALVGLRLSEGTITSKDDVSTLEKVAEHLRSGLIGLYYQHPEHHVLIYPTKCEEWNGVSLGQDPTSSSDVALRYLVFSTDLDCANMLRYPKLSKELDEGYHPPTDYTVPDPDTRVLRSTLTERLFNFKYAKLLASNPTQPDAHYFFLAFPESRETTLLAIYHWLRACNPDCRIYTSDRPGSWEAFRAESTGQGVSSVVIVHESLAWSIRRFPKLYSYLLTYRDEYWVFSEPMRAQLLYPSMTNVVAAPGDCRFTRIFPHRTAILLTPSFLVSEPERAHELLNWFLGKWAKGFDYRLVTAYNVYEYMHELAVEKSKARNELRNDGNLKSTEVAFAENLRGLSTEECTAAFLGATLASELHYVRERRGGLYGAEEDNSSLIYADPSIDPNDEQSLVNWFGWWSTLRVDQFRKFHVVGSSPTIGFQGSKRGERFIQIPKYTPVTLNDPDAVLEVFQKKEEIIGSPSMETTIEAKPEVPQQTSQPDRQSQPPWAFKSNLINGENIQQMVDVLERLNNSFKDQKKPWTLYKFPVSWLDFDMADYFGDGYNSLCRRIVEWFAFPWSFVDQSRIPWGWNTFVGFFYTITEDWDPKKPPGSRTPRRHPWIAIYRPVRPHLRPFNSGTELLIWDCAARDKFPRPDQQPTESGLLDMQRRLIQYIRENDHNKNPGLPLERVWLGGFDPLPPESETPYPFDATMEYLRLALNDVRYYLPAPDGAMTQRGFRRVRLASDEHGSGGHNSNRRAGGIERRSFADSEADDVPMDLDSPGSDDDYTPPDADVEGSEDQENTRIIFHPPRGTKMQPGQRSRCANRLHEEARLARAHDKRATVMRYQFVPTLEWYALQQAEGRSYEHINVDSWERIFNYLHIGGGGSSGRPSVPGRSDTGLSNNSVAAGAGLGSREGSTITSRRDSSVSA